ncbi:hypothetical protein [Flavobacterium subsaxonicum]|uniref:Uncharacterized protein n=1 Tax=Flavobacterium subsaxonicum WB 4.1-42 = DSM 21790 TaxID=1121898 RepID=A0A0A2MQK2_9FLAO|nr:hypothetical protein [Flavobacterium subsaxonicum]KGO93718.1 hypothetical protein Q766_07110 [Flavobacterium subsaxonicum WB 4.1-42 = DSM 21790]
MESKPKYWLKLACIIVLAIILFASLAQAVSLLFVFSLLPQDNGLFGIVRSICSGLLGVMMLLALLSAIAILLNQKSYFYYLFAVAVVLGGYVALV